MKRKIRLGRWVLKKKIGESTSTTAGRDRHQIQNKHRCRSLKG